MRGIPVRCMVVSRGTIWMPSQKEPQTSHGRSLSSMTKLGSMAFQLSRFSREVTMHPSSCHIGNASERLLSSPIADPFLPNVEQLYAIHHRPCQWMTSGAHTWFLNPGTESEAHPGTTVITGFGDTVHIFRSFDVICCIPMPVA